MSAENLTRTLTELHEQRALTSYPAGRLFAALWHSLWKDYIRDGTPYGETKRGMERWLKDLAEGELG